MTNGMVPLHGMGFETSTVNSRHVCFKRRKTPLHPIYQRYGTTCAACQPIVGWDRQGRVGDVQVIGACGDPDTRVVYQGEQTAPINRNCIYSSILISSLVRGMADCVPKS
jgi:hypothetical protein